MESAAYEQMSVVQDRHWWFKARKEILSAIIEDLQLPSDATILEVGCGTGGNIDMLRRYGKLSAVESNAYARDFAAKAKNIIVLNGMLPGSLPFEQGSFDLICLFDVLEHIAQDQESLVALRSLLKRNGILLLTVPAYQWLFGAHDRILHHQRRYTFPVLSRKLEQSGFSVTRGSYFNSLLFPVVLAVRLLELVLRPQNPTGNEIPHPLINRLMYNIFRSEKTLLAHMNIPFGTSIFIAAKSSAQD